MTAVDIKEIRFIRQTLRPLVVIASIIILEFTGLSGLFSQIFKSVLAAAPITDIITSGTTWTVPPAWSDTNNTIEAIGAGGNGAVSTSSTSGGGGGGGEYESVTNVSLTPNTTVAVNIPSAGSGSAAAGTYLQNNSGTTVIEAMNGGNASGTASGSGGSGGIGTTSFNGGAGGSGASGAEGSGAGGGGSAGPTGIGQSGAGGVSGTKTGGGGGGGSDGGSSSAGLSHSGTSGGAGGNGTSGTGGGSGGTVNGNNAQSGTAGGGGGGGGESTGSGIVPGANGGTEDLWASGQGPSGGGGGGGGAGGTAASGSKNGGNGGTYGGGGGGAGFSGKYTFTGGSGGQGILVITYTSSVNPVVTQANYRFFQNPAVLSQPWQDCNTQDGETTINSGSSTATVTLGTPIVSLSQAYLMTSATADGNDTSGDQHMVGGTITNTTTLTFQTGANVTDPVYIAYSLVECYNNEFSVQSGSTTIASGSSNATATINSVSTANSIVIVSGYNNDTSANEQTSLATGSLQNPTTLYVERSSAASINDTIDWQVVTFSSTSGASVQSGTTLLSSGSASTTATISSVNTGSSWLYCSWDANTNGLQADAVGCDLTNPTTLTFNRYAANSYVNNVQWYVVTFPSSSVSVQRGAYADKGGVTDNTEYDIELAINPVDSLNKIFTYQTNTSSGTGTAFPRDDWISQLTSTSNLQITYYRGSSSGAGTHYWQVIDFLQPTEDVGTPLGAQNTPVTLAYANEPFRLRMLLNDSLATLGQGTAYALQYAVLNGSCSSSTYNDVTASSPIAFHVNEGLTNGMAVVADSNDPVDGTNPTVTESYVDSNNFTNSQVISPGSDGEWDFSLTDLNSPANTTYCLRAVKSSGTLLGSYSYYPEVTTSNGAFSVDMVNGSGGSLSSPVANMSAVGTSFNCQTSTGTLGTTSSRIRVLNNSADPAWSVTAAATSGNTTVWYDGSDQYSYNNPNGSPPGCASGLLSFNFNNFSTTPETGCSSSGILSGASTYFNQGVTDSVTLVTAGSSSSQGCYWDFEGIGLSQKIPSIQPAGNYSINLTLTLTAE